MPTLSKWPHFNARFSKIVQIFGLTLLIILLQRSPSVAQSSAINRARITQVLDSPQVFIQNKQAKVNDLANKGQRVRTGPARAQLTFNTGAVGRLAHNSVLTVGQQCARLQQGTLLVNGAMNGCTGAIVAGVRGTTYILEASETGEARVKVLEGEVTVAHRRLGEVEAKPLLKARSTLPVGVKQFAFPSLPIHSPKPPTSRSEPFPVPLTLPTIDQRVLKAGQKVSISPAGTLGVVEQLSQQDFTSLLTGNLFKGFTAPLPGMAKIRSSFQRLFPGVPFPLSLPIVPRIPIPIRFPFPF